ncbi:hypothetical protein CXB51_005881 [Gossypium anomalum]|uniref:Uncharacterized protein n=1 Tax=Gossypium anomalum TaxID=47600 RepID=A0A8J6DA18_9ROSI|nr:hypothetical protein CXB51_005881 [Gossypium anomalum]
MDLFHFGTSSNLTLMDQDMPVMNGAEGLHQRYLMRFGIMHSIIKT